MAFVLKHQRCCNYIHIPCYLLNYNKQIVIVGCEYVITTFILRYHINYFSKHINSKHFQI